MIRLLALCLSLTLLVPACAPTAPSSVSAQSSSPAGGLEGRMILPGSRNDLSQLRASVDGQPVELEIRNIRAEADQTVIEYRILNLPALEGRPVYTVEILTRDGYPLLGGVVRFTPGRAMVYDFDVRSTALLLKLRQKHAQVGQISLAELRSFELDPQLIADMEQIRTELRRNGTLQQHAILDLDDQDGQTRED